MRPLRLAPGRYWFDLFPSDESRFAEWSRDPRVTVRTTSGRPGELTWVLFEISEPIVWPLPGRPTRAAADVDDPSDVVDRPEPQPDPEWRDGSVFGIGSAGGWIAGGLAAVVAAYVLGRWD